jgi:hypothetical protein
MTAETTFSPECPEQGTSRLLVRHRVGAGMASDDQTNRYVMTCFCGAEIESGLAALGSTACLDCRSDYRRLASAIDERRLIEAERIWIDGPNHIRLAASKAA